jgi:uncharacterized membrane protein YhiD involved in acid resistance
VSSILAEITNWYESLTPEVSLVVLCGFNMILGGLVGIYLRALYLRFGGSMSNRENLANIFPVLTVITVVMIFVVKSSLALSLGLVGALSIVRFRTAIKTPEELVYLFFCIGVGLAFGAEHGSLALVATLVVTVFIVGRGLLSRKARRHNLLLTVTGEGERFFEESGESVLDVVGGLTEGVAIQRLDMENGQVQFRANVALKGPDDATALVSQLRSKLPKFRISYVNLDRLL